MCVFVCHQIKIKGLINGGHWHNVPSWDESLHCQHRVSAASLEIMWMFRVCLCCTWQSFALFFYTFHQLSSDRLRCSLGSIWDEEIETRCHLVHDLNHFYFTSGFSVEVKSVHVVCRFKKPWTLVDVLKFCCTSTKWCAGDIFVICFDFLEAAHKKAKVRHFEDTRLWLISLSRLYTKLVQCLFKTGCSTQISSVLNVQSAKFSTSSGRSSAPACWTKTNLCVNHTYPLPSPPTHSALSTSEFSAELRKE